MKKDICVLIIEDARVAKSIIQNEPFVTYVNFLPEEKREELVSKINEID